MNYSKRTILYDGKLASRTTEYSSWGNMRSRCKKEYAESEFYYKKGIKVCDRWNGKSGFLNFYADMGKKPTKAHSIDRIDNNKGYSPDNCRWATKREQAINRKLYCTNSSGYRGVSWYKQTQRWRAGIDNRTIGYFVDVEMAARAYDEEAIKAHGDFACTNFRGVKTHAI